MTSTEKKKYINQNVNWSRINYDEIVKDINDHIYSDWFLCSHSLLIFNSHAPFNWIERANTYMYEDNNSNWIWLKQLEQKVLIAKP